LRLIKNESDGPATYFVIDDLCDALNLPVPSVKKVIESIESDGFHVTPTHFSTRGVRTDAPASELANIIRRLTSDRAENENVPS